jgi:predicted RecB family nuclease
MNFVPLNSLSQPIITPTDITQFVRLEQCQRYLRLRLQERNFGPSFFNDYDVVPQTVTPILQRSGAEFESMIEASVAACYASENLAPDNTASTSRHDDNDHIVATVQELQPGQTRVLFQPRLVATVEGWLLRGDVDILRLERDSEGAVHVLIVDMKSSASAKVEHRLQVAFYHQMLRQLLLEHGVEEQQIELGILYRGPENVDELSPLEQETLAQQKLAAQQHLGIEMPLELIGDVESYLDSVRDMVTNEASVAHRVGNTPLEELPFYLARHCDGCRYQEFCLKWSAQNDDLSLLPYLSPQEKSALQRAGIQTVQELAKLKQFRGETQSTLAQADVLSEAEALSEADAEATGTAPTPQDLVPEYVGILIPTPGHEDLVKRVSTTWPVGPRLDELVHRARRYRRWKGDPLRWKREIPSKGYGSLPYCDAKQNPNLVRIYLDAQHDYLHDRIYMMGALVVGCEDGVPVRRRQFAAMTSAPPRELFTTDEAATQAAAQREGDLFLRWSQGLIQAVDEVVAADANGERRAPIHLIFWNGTEQGRLLEGLARHSSTILAATPLYDFVTQLAAFDSPIASFLDQEIRELKNYPLLSQSLQAVAEHLKFDWDAPHPFRQIFHERHFDAWGRFNEAEVPAGDEKPWYARRARFSSQIPLEYAYAAWDELPRVNNGKDEFKAFRGATVELLQAFQLRRLEALEFITEQFKGNRQTEKREFEFPKLEAFQGKAPTFAHALDEFVTIERHVSLGAWKKAKLAPPERRVLGGETLVVKYYEEDQDPAIVALNRENAAKSERYEAWKAAHPDQKASKEESKSWSWLQEGLTFRLRLETTGIDCDLDQILALSTLREGERVVISRRVDVDSRLPKAQQYEYTPTPKQMLYGSPADIEEIEVEQGSNGKVTRAWVRVQMQEPRGGKWSRGFVFAGWKLPLNDGTCYTLDSDPNDWYGYFCAKTVEGLCEGGQSTLYQRLAEPAEATVHWPAAAQQGQMRFLAGLQKLHEVGALHGFEPSKLDYIGGHGAAQILLVQGPPGTGKSYSTAFAVFARLQGALAAEMEWRVFLSCKTHAATDVLLHNVQKVQQKLKKLRDEHPQLWAQYFDERLLKIPLFRAVVTEASDGIVPLPKKDDQEKGEPQSADVIQAEKWCVVGTTPGGVYRLLKDRYNKLFGRQFCHCLVLDEASQMNLPEAIMAALALVPEGQLIVVGDHRQMPPIIKHDWEFEPRRTFQDFQSYASLFESLLAQDPQPPMIKFAESFRLHADMAEFLRREIYQQDGIAYHSQRHDTLPLFVHEDMFVASVLTPEHPLIVVLHDEVGSLLSNEFEAQLIRPVLETLADLAGHALDAADGLGVVVPHRAQRAKLRDERWNVDTVERFQGDERLAILVGATESDREYLLVSGKFLLDPRRLTVALSRAKQKMILVASQSVFNVFSPDEETFANAQLWKNLLRRTCTTPLWQGERHGQQVQVWGNVSTKI